MKRKTPSFHTRSEMPWILAVLGGMLLGWYAYNRYVLQLYPIDISEGGKYHVITYGSDPNPARIEQKNILGLPGFE